MRVWLLTIGEPLPVDGPDERLFRTGILAQTLADRGHEVTWWSSAFDHVRKSFRAPETTSVQVNGYMLVMLKGSGYSKNISRERLADHRLVAKEFARLAPVAPRPDVILCSIPIVELATEALKLGVPVALDCRDMWPDIFADSVPAPARPIAKLALAGLTRETRAAFAKADAILGHTRPFVEWGLQYANRAATEWDRDFPFGYNATEPEAQDLAQAESYWDDLHVRSDDQRVRLCFFGAVGHQFRFKELVTALKPTDRDQWQFVICGEGESVPWLREQAAALGHNCLVVPGWVDRPKIAALMARSHLGLAPYNDEPMYRASIPNKVIEYWSSGLPVAWQVPTGLLADMIPAEGVGIVFRDADDLGRQVLDLVHSHPEQLRAMNDRAKALYENKFRAEKVYADFADHLEALARK